MHAHTDQIFRHSFSCNEFTLNICLLLYLLRDNAQLMCVQYYVDIITFLIAYSEFIIIGVVCGVCASIIK